MEGSSLCRANGARRARRLRHSHRTAARAYNAHAKAKLPACALYGYTLPERNFFTNFALRTFFFQASDQDDAFVVGSAGSSSSHAQPFAAAAATPSAMAPRAAGSGGAAPLASVAAQPTHVSPSAALVEQMIEEKVIDGMKLGAAIKAKEELSFGLPPDVSIWRASVAIAEREASWQRKEISLKMAGIDVHKLPKQAVEGKLFFVQKKVQMRGGKGPDATIRARPDMYNYVVHGPWRPT